MTLVVTSRQRSKPQLHPAKGQSGGWDRMTVFRYLEPPRGSQGRVQAIAAVPISARGWPINAVRGPFGHCVGEGR